LPAVGFMIKICCIGLSLLASVACGLQILIIVAFLPQKCNTLEEIG
jgi:hypothetical protein